MSFEDLRELLYLLEEFGVTQFSGFGVALTIPSPATKTQVEPVEQPLPIIPGISTRPTPSSSLWDDPSLWPGKRLGFDGSLK